MMRQMRENTKWIMLITALAFVGLMVFEWGMDMSGQSGSQLQGGEVGSIDGEPVTSTEYDRFYRELYDRRQAESQSPITPSETREIGDMAWEQLVTDRLLRRELDRLGITATDEEVVQAARYAPPPTFASNSMFQTDGQFDFDKYHAFLTSPMTDPALLRELEAYYRDVIPRNRLFQRVASGIYTPDSELWRMWRDRNETASIRYLMLEPQRLVPDAAVSAAESDIAAYYEAHSEDFRQPARATIRFVTLDARPSAEDTAAAREHAEYLHGQIEEGADFAEIARAESADPASASRGGDVGTVTREQVPESFAQVAWSIPIGVVSEPVATELGFHLVRVQERTDSTVRVSQVLVPIELTRENEDLLLTRADSLEDMTENFTLARAAQELGLSVREAAVSASQPFVPGVGSLEEGVYWAFNEAEAEGEVSRLFETDDLYYVVELAARTPEHVLSLEEARPAIRMRVLERMKLERARQTARDMVDRIRQGATLEAVAQPHRIQVQEAGPFSRVDFVTGIGRANAVIGAAFGLQQPGQVSNVVEANGSLYIVELVEKNEASREEWEAQKAQQARMVTAALEEARVRQYMDELRSSAEILDRRAEARAAAAAASSTQLPTSPFF